MSNKDTVIRLRKSDRDGGEALDWVLFPMTNQASLPSVIGAYDPAKQYKAGTFVNKDGVLLKAAVTVHPKRDPFYGSNDNLINETPVPLVTGQEDVVASIYTFTKNATVTIKVNLEASTLGANSLTATFRTATQNKDISTHLIENIGATPETHELSFDYMGTEGEEIVLHIEQAAAQAKQWKPSGLSGMTGQSTIAFGAGYYLAVDNAGDAFLSGHNNLTMVSIAGGNNEPDFTDSFFAIDKITGEVYAAADMAEVISKRDMTTGDWTNVPDANPYSVYTMTVSDGKVAIFDGDDAMVHLFKDDAWSRIDNLGTTPITNVVDMVYSGDKLYVHDGNLKKVMVLTDADEWEEVVDLTGKDVNDNFVSYSMVHDTAADTFFFLTKTGGIISYNKATEAWETVADADSTALAIVVGKLGRIVASELEVYTLGLDITIGIPSASIAEPIIDIPDAETGPDFVESEWVKAEGLEAIVIPHNTEAKYPADSVIVDTVGALWYTSTALEPGEFKDQPWERLRPEDGIQSGYAYLDPTTENEQATTVRGAFVDVETVEGRIPEGTVAFFDTSDKYSLFQDVRGTVPVEVTGDTVRFIADQVGNKHIVFGDPDVHGVYAEDDNGRGYVRIINLSANEEKNVKLRVIGDNANYHLRHAVPNVGVLRSGTYTLDEGISIKASDYSEQLVTQLALVADGTDPLVLAKIDARMRRIADRYAPIVTSLNNYFDSQKQQWVFEGDVSLRFIRSMVETFARSTVTQDLTKLDVSGVEDFTACFQTASGTLAVEEWDMSGAKVLDHMFMESPTFNGDLSAWDVSNVVSAERMFSKTALFDQSIIGLNWGRLTNARGMFADAVVYNQTLSGLNAPRLQAIDDMLANARAYNQPFEVTLPQLLTAKGLFEGGVMNSVVSITAPMLSDVSYMFCNNVVFNAAVTFSSEVITDSTRAFKGAVAFDNIVTMSFASVKEAGEMFKGAVVLNKAFGFVPTALVTGTRMFEGCEALTVNPFASLVFPQLVDGESMFEGCVALAIPVIFAAPNATKIVRAFKGCAALTGPFSFSVTRAADLTELAMGCTALNGAVTINARRATVLDSLLQDCAALNDTVTLVTPLAESAGQMMKGCLAFDSEISFTSTMVTNWANFLEGATAYNQPIKLDMAMAEDATGFLKDCTSFNSSVLDVPFNYIAIISEFLSGCTSFDQDLSSICVSNHATQPTDFVTDNVPMAADAAKQPAWGAVCS